MMKLSTFVLFTISCFSFSRAFSQTVDCWLTTPDKTALLSRQPSLTFQTSNASSSNAIAIDPDKTYQSIDGFGFALTGGSAQHLINMKGDERKKILQELFARDDNSIGISYLRLSIGASDLNDHVFSYDDLPAGQTDIALTKFDLGQDKKDVIPVLKEILAINPRIKILGSPWSAPTWMKTNSNIQGGRLKEEYYAAYANYFVKYITQMRQQGIHIDAVTLQNEPFNDGNTPSMQMFAKEQARFIKNSVGPAFKANKIDTKIVLYDHNCDAPEYPMAVLADSLANQYIDGSGFHLYAGPITALSKVHDAFPNKNVYFTEMMATSRNGNFNIASPVDRILIGATRNWSKNVILWNLAANSAFQPHTDNGGCPFCQGAITIDGDKIERNVAYYVIGHASKFVTQNAVRVESTSTGDLTNVAFKTQEGNVVLIVANKGKQAQLFSIGYRNKQATTTLDAGAVATYVWRNL